MNAAQLIEALKGLPPETEITIVSHDEWTGFENVPVTGVSPEGALRDWEVV